MDIAEQQRSTPPEDEQRPGELIAEVLGDDLATAFERQGRLQEAFDALAEVRGNRRVPPERRARAWTRMLRFIAAGASAETMRAGSSVVDVINLSLDGRLHWEADYGEEGGGEVVADVQ